MAEAIEAGADLVLIAGLLLCIGLLYGAKWIAHGIRSIFDFSLPLIGKPFAWLGNAIAGLIEDGADAGISASDKALASLFSGLIDSLGILIGVPIALALSIKDAFSALWNHYLVPRIRHYLDPVAADASHALAELESIGGSVARNVGAGEAYALGVGAKLLDDATGFATHEVNALRAAVMPTLLALDHYVHNAEAGAIALPGEIGADFDSLWKGLQDRIRPFNLEELLGAGLLAGLLVRVLTQEAGLQDAECRSKVKGICGTNPAQWAKLLEGIGLVVGLVKLDEVVALCRPLVRPAFDLVSQAA